MLFADMAGALSAWGMNIVKADAFSNSEGVILDSFQFTDPFRTLELNPGEHERFLMSMREMLSGTNSVRRHAECPSPSAPGGGAAPPYGCKAALRFRQRQLQPQHASAGGRPGFAGSSARRRRRNQCHRLQYRSGAVDTEGEIAIDVFYLTVRRADGRRVKLTDAQQNRYPRESRRYWSAAASPIRKRRSWRSRHSLHKVLRYFPGDIAGKRNAPYERRVSHPSGTCGPRPWGRRVSRLHRLAERHSRRGLKVAGSTFPRATVAAYQELGLAFSANHTQWLGALWAEENSCVGRDTCARNAGGTGMQVSDHGQSPERFPGEKQLPHRGNGSGSGT